MSSSRPGFVPEMQQVNLSPLSSFPSSTFQLSYNGALTQPIPVGANAATIDAALEALGIDPGAQRHGE